jgi:hypothetical protein
MNPEGSVEPSELRPLRAVVQEDELLPKGKVLEDQIPAPSQGRAERPQQGDNDGPGRPPIGSELRALIREIAHANPLWSAPRIHGEILNAHQA